MPDDLLINFLTHYGQNLTEQARQGRLRKAYGRDAEVEAVLRRLARPRDARPLLVGPPRVGKTAIIHEVVRRMVQGNCPESLRGMQVYELAPPQIVTALGTEWRDQLHGFLRDLGSRESTLVYFRDFPSALGAGIMGMFGGPDLATLLAQHLRGESLRCIAEARTNAMRRMSDFLPIMDEVFTHFAIEEPAQLHTFLDTALAGQGKAASSSARLRPEACPELCRGAALITELTFTRRRPNVHTDNQ